MMRFGFFLLSATLVVASLAWWGRPESKTGSETPTAEAPVAAPEAAEIAAAPLRRDAAAPPAAVSPPPATGPAAGAPPPAAAGPPPADGSPTQDPVTEPAAAPASGASAEAPVDRAATPILAEAIPAEEDVIEVEPRGSFPGEGAGDDGVEARASRAGTEDPEEGADTEDAVAEDDLPPREPEPVDMDRAGDLVRRMLALYEAIGE